MKTHTKTINPTNPEMVKYDKRVEDDMSYLMGFFSFLGLEAIRLSESALAKNVTLIWQKQLPIVLMKKIIFNTKMNKRNK